MIGGIILAWFLTLFNFDHAVIKAFQELFNITISTGTYYVIFAVLGAIANK